MINIVPILKNKKEFLELLLLADEQESMIDLYLERGEMFALYDIATYPHYQRKGYGTQLIKFLLEHYKDRYQTMLVGTGDSTYTIPFYERCGFTYSHRIPDFFIKNYDHPMYEDGKQLRDMVYLKISKNG